MKAIKGFVKTCYSEVLIPTSSAVVDNEREDGSLMQEGEAGASETVPERSSQGGLGLRFKFPGDAKKYVVALDHVRVLITEWTLDSEKLQK